MPGSYHIGLDSSRGIKLPKTSLDLTYKLAFGGGGGGGGYLRCGIMNVEIKPLHSMYIWQHQK